MKEITYTIPVSNDNNLTINDIAETLLLNIPNGKIESSFIIIKVNGISYRMKYIGDNRE